LLVLDPEKKISPEFNPRVVVGYHGTSIEKAELALRHKELLVSRDDSGDWLAEGAYFWEDSLDMAQRWAQERHGSKGAVLRAEIRLGRCLNLMDSKWNEALEAGRKEVETQYNKNSAPLPHNIGHRHYLDFQVVKHLCEHKFSVDTVRGAFQGSQQLYEGGFDQLAHVQIAVRNPDMILSIERSYPFPFRAYLASALTGLSSSQREQIDARQGLVKEVSRKRGIDLYLPKEKTDPELHKNIPAEDVFFADIQQVLASDLIILMTEHPSFGGGMELKTALDAQLPILLISPRDARVSRMVLGIPSTRSYHVKYVTDEELRLELEKGLSFLKQSMTDRKDSLKTLENTVGTSIKKYREKSGFSREQLVATIGVTPDALKRIEESPDYLTNLSLLALRKLVQVLGTRASDIVDPEFVAEVGFETLKLAQDTDLLVKARQGKGKIPLEDQFSIIRVALEERLAKKNRDQPSRSN